MSQINIDKYKIKLILQKCISKINKIYLMGFQTATKSVKYKQHI